MNKNFKIMILVCLLLLATNNLALANDVSGNTITDIEVQGNAQIDANKVLEQVNIEVGDKVVNEELKKDLESIYELGYFSNVKINFQNYQDGVRLIFQVVENPTLSKIELEGNNVVSTSKLKELLQVKTGEMLNANQLKEGIQAINEYYQQEGYVVARVVDRKIKNDDQLYLEINEGQLNQIKIEGNTKTKESVIRREFDIEPGDTFDMKQIRIDLRDIHQLKLFDQVKPEFKHQQDNPQAINLTVNITEGKTNEFQTALTYNPDSGLAGLLDLAFKNYFGRAKKIKTKWEYGANKNHYEIGYTDPWAAWLFDRKTSLDFSLYNKEDTYVDDKKEKKRGGDFSIGRQLTDNTKGYFGLDISKTKQEDEESWQDERVLNLKTIRNTTRNPLNPRTGSKQTISLEKSGLLGGDKDYTKYSFDFRNYIPSLEENSWAFRLKVAGSRGDLTETKRYYLANSDLVRGYEDNYYKTNEDDNYDPEAEGFIGNSLLLGSIEYRYPIVDKLRGLFFIDAGKTFTNNDINLYDDSNFKYSIGLGVRVATPIGELGVDYGYAPEAEEYSKSDVEFAIGNKF